MKLYINGKDKGEVRGFHKNSLLNRYSFLMCEGYYISVDIDNLKSFTRFLEVFPDIYIEIYG